MKKDDLKKLYKNDSNDLKLVTILSKFLSIFFFAFSISFSQVHVNGFYRINNYKTFPDYTGIYQTDFNGDSFTDVILFNGINNNVVSNTSTDNGTFLEPKNKFFFFPITAINYFGINNDKDIVNVFVSRKERLAGLISFTKYGTLKLLNIVRFPTYPSKVITADLNNDGNNEALIFGETFGGLALLEEKNSILKDTVVVDSGAYSAAAFINLDYDNYTDIAAINMLNNSIDFFYNNGNNDFVNERQLEFPTQIADLKAVDFNKDYYHDLIFISGNSFQILLGDSVSAFNNRITITTGDQIFKYAIGDFNSDELNDIAYIDGEKNNIKILFGITDSTFTKPILYFHHQNLSNLQYFQEGKTKGLLSLSTDGILSKFTNNSSLPDSFEFAFGGNPFKLSWENYLKSNRFKLSFIDKYDLSFKSIIGKKSSFNKLYEIPISKIFSNIETSNTDEINESTLFFNKRERLIEFLQSEADSSKQKQLYANHPILDAKPINIKGKNQPSIIAVTSSDSSAGTTFFNLNNSQFEKSDFDSLDTNVIDANIFIGNNLEVFYWKLDADTLLYIRKNLYAKNSHIIYSTQIELDSVGALLTSVKLFENKSFPTAEPISVIQQKNVFNILLIENGKMKIISLAEGSLGNKIKSIENIKYFFDGKIRQNSFFILANDSTAIFKLDVDKNFKPQSLSQYIESVKVYDYFITKLFDIYNYIVYTSESDNCIKFLRIK